MNPEALVSLLKSNKKLAFAAALWLLFRCWKKRVLVPRDSRFLTNEYIPKVGRDIQIKSHYGTTSALELGPSDAAETILFLHGFPDTKNTFFRQLPFFSEKGYRVIAPTLPGYELSCTPTSYHISNIARVVLAWIDALGLEKVHIVGHDWGAVITYIVCALEPERFYSATTVAIPHLKHFKNRLHKMPIQFRLFAEWCVQRNDSVFIDKLWADWSPNHPTYTREVKDLFQNTAILKNALSYYRALLDLLSGYGKETMRLSGRPIRVPCLAITGTRDGCMDTRLHDVMMDASCFEAPYRIRRLARSGHFAHQEEWQQFNTWVYDWISQHNRLRASSSAEANTNEHSLP